MDLKIVKRKNVNALYIRGSANGRRIYESTGTSDPALAEKYREKRKKELYEQCYLGYSRPITFTEAVDHYFAFEARSSNEIARYQRLAAHFKSLTMSDIGQAAADEACLKILRAGAAPATRIREIYTPLSALITFCAGRGWCSPVAFQTPRVTAGKIAWVAPRDALDLIQAATAHLQPLLLFCFCTGARLSEALDLTWEDVDLKAAQVILHDVKNGKRTGGARRVAALPPRAVAALSNLEKSDRARLARPKRLATDRQAVEHMPARRDGAVFVTDEGIPYVNQGRTRGGQIKTSWRTACLKVPNLCRPVLDARGAPVRDGEGRIMQEPFITPHDMRHSWATWFYGASRDVLLLKNEGGWQTLSMAERYTHLMPRALVGDIPLVWGPTHPRISWPLPDNREQKKRA